MVNAARWGVYAQVSAAVLHKAISVLKNTSRLCKHVPVTAQHERECKLIFQSGSGPIGVPMGFKRNVGDFFGLTLMMI